MSSETIKPTILLKVISPKIDSDPVMDKAELLQKYFPTSCEQLPSRQEENPLEHQLSGNIELDQVNQEDYSQLGQNPSKLIEYVQLLDGKKNDFPFLPSAYDGPVSLPWAYEGSGSSERLNISCSPIKFSEGKSRRPQNLQEIYDGAVAVAERVSKNLGIHLDQLQVDIEMGQAQVDGEEVKVCNSKLPDYPLSSEGRELYEFKLFFLGEEPLGCTYFVREKDPSSDMILGL